MPKNTKSPNTRPTDAKRAPSGVKSKRETIARRQARNAKRAAQGR